MPTVPKMWGGILIGCGGWLDKKIVRLKKEYEMPKYGRGLNREIVGAVNSGLIPESFSTKDIRKLIKTRNWYPCPPENYINVTLANAASDSHSATYKKYFISVGDSQYKLRSQYKGNEWR